MTITDYLRQIRENAWSSRQLGTEFERFVKRYFKAEPFYSSQFDEVWLWGECPFAKGNDIGIDLVARTKFGEYVAIQAKCYQPGTQVDKADVDTFLSASGKQIAPDGKPTYYSQRIIIATNDNWTSHASEAIVDQQIPVIRIGLAQIQESAIDWEKFFAGAKKTIVKKTTRPHQDAAIADVIKGFKTRERGQLIMACGEHKYWSVWAAEIAEVVQTQIKRITALLNEKDSPYEKDFVRFHETLKDNLNKTVTRDEAIAMLAQQLVSAPVFDALFADYQFIRNNPISKSLEKLLFRLNENIDGKDRETLEKFYESVRHKASDKTTAAQKQSIVVQLYNNFFNIAFKDTVEKLGIVYTPVPVVDFIIKSVECVLKKHFCASISDRGVHVLDPFTGTGTFITRLLQSGFIKPKDLLYKYENEIHANEIVLLAYYIAAINIESVFHDVYGEVQTGLTGFTRFEDSGGVRLSQPNPDNLVNPVKKESAYHPFDGIVLTDTFQLTESSDSLPGIFPENSERARKQKKLDIRVILGNPPYNVSKGTTYPHLEQRIAETYAKGSGAVNKNSLYDSYIKAFRWASDRIRDEGVVAFVTNGGWLDAQAMNGFRNALVNEFSHIYVFNLRGNQRTQGEVSRREGGKIFGSGSRTPVAITILVKGGKEAK